MRKRTKKIAVLATLALVALLSSCGRHAVAPSSELPPGFSVLPGTNGIKYQLTVVITNSRPPVVRSVVLLSDKQEYYRIRIGKDGQQQDTVNGEVPPEVYRGLLRESKSLPGVIARDDGLIYFTKDDEKHPRYIQQLLDLAAR